MSLIPSDDQLAIVHRPVSGLVFLEGPAGAGKTTAGVLRMLHLLREGVAGRSILIVVPQRTLATPYYAALRRPTVDAGGQVTITTIGGLAQRTVDLFWPLVAERAGFVHPDRPPTFLTLETAQYYMARLVLPLFDGGYFETVAIHRNRIYSQVIDGLNKASVVGFPHTEIGPRLKEAWGGEQSQSRIYDEAHACAVRFREYCLAHNLLDFSLQMDVFCRHLWPLPMCRDYLMGTYRHLLVDNVEEDTPVAHEILRDWLEGSESALVIADRDGGYRRFLGADPGSGLALRELCDERAVFPESCVTSPSLRAFGSAIDGVLAPGAGTGRVLREGPRTRPRGGDRRPPVSFLPALVFGTARYYPETLDWVSERIAELVHGRGVSPGEIVVLAPFLSDRLRFALANRLSERAVPARSHRPSRALREEPAARCLRTLTAIAHPEWALHPTPYDVAYSLMQAIEGMDLVRAQLLTQIAYRATSDGPALSSFDRIVPQMQERLTYVLGERYERLRVWLDDYAKGEGVAHGSAVPSGLHDGGETPLDYFLSRLFSEVLSRPGYGFHRDYDAARVAATMIESFRKFRWVAQAGGSDGGNADENLGREYLAMVEDGVIAAQYISGWQSHPEDAILLAPAYTFLMQNRPVDYQVWLNVGSRGWWERLYQPLTHPYVLSRRWPRGQTWTDVDEVETRQLALRRLVLGLVRRCRRGIYLGLSELDEQGNDQKGPLLQAIQRALRNEDRAVISRG